MTVRVDYTSDRNDTEMILSFWGTDVSSTSFQTGEHLFGQKEFKTVLMIIFIFLHEYDNND